MPLDVTNTQIDCHLAYSCASAWFYVIGIFILAVEATSTIFLLILASGPILTYFIILKLAIPQPNNAVATEVLGCQIKREDIDSANPTSNLSNGDGYNGIIMNVIAHRFAGLDAPENTLEALDLCYRNSAMAAEFDLVLTKDLVPVVFHDDTLDRVTNVTGEIKNKTWEELKTLDVSVNHPFHGRFQGCKIPLFDDVIQKLIEYDMRIFIDIKDDRHEITNIILETFRKYPILYRRAVVSSFNFWVVYGIRRKDSNIVASMAWRPYYMSYCRYSAWEEGCIPYSTSPFEYYYTRMLDHLNNWFFNNLAYHLCGFSAVLLHKDVITPEIVTYWKLRNVRVIAWTVNKPIEKLHLVRNLGIAYMTDSMLGSE